LPRISAAGGERKILIEKKKMLATRWRDKSPNNFIFIAQRFVDCYILARTKAERCQRFYSFVFAAVAS